MKVSNVIEKANNLLPFNPSSQKKLGGPVIESLIQAILDEIEIELTQIQKKINDTRTKKKV